MRAAYDYADDPQGDPPLELETAWRVNDIGAGTVLGDNAPAYLVRRVSLSGAVYRAYLSRAAYRDKYDKENWTEWARLHPEQSRLLNMAARDE